ncbi:MAG: hypothetical protein ACO1SV_07780 [Fimbriimonas sp.]
MLLVVVGIIGFFGYRVSNSRTVDSWETTPPDVRDKIGKMYGNQPKGGSPPPQSR